MSVAIQPSLLAALEPDEELLGCIITPEDERWPDAVAEWLEAKYFCIDTETCARPQFLDQPHYALNPWKGFIRLIQIGLKSGKVLVVDLGRSQIDERKERSAYLKEVGFFELLRDRMGDPACLKIGQNLKFDLLYLYLHYQIHARGLRDTMIMSQIYWAGLERSHSLEAICERLGIPIDKSQQKTDWSWDLTNKQINYAAVDVQAPITAYRRLGKLIQEDPYSPDLKGSVISACECISAFVEMEAYGVPVDLELLEENLIAYQNAADDVIKPFLDKFPGVNPNSKEQVLPVIEKEWGVVPLAKNDRTGQMEPSISSDALAVYWHIPELKALSTCKTLQTMIAYMKGVKECVYDYPHPTVYPYAKGIYFIEGDKGFGRSTCKSKDELKKPTRLVRKGVNLLNPPSKIPAELKERYKLPKFRRFFKPKKGTAFIVGDLSQAHARIACEASQDPVLLKVYLEDADNHCITAERVAKTQGLDWDAVSIKQWAKKDKTHPNHPKANALRELSKIGYYTFLNAGSDKSIKDSCDTQGFPISLEEASTINKELKNVYSVLAKFMRKINDEANKHDYKYKGKTYGVVTCLGGRRIFLPKMDNKFRPNDPPQVKFNEAVSFFWTATESDAMKLAMVGIIQEFDEHPEWNAKFCEYCYDEVGVICREEYWMEVAKAIQVNMQAGMKNFISGIPVDEKYKFKNYKLNRVFFNLFGLTNTKSQEIQDVLLAGYTYYVRYASAEGLLVSSWADK